MSHQWAVDGATAALMSPEYLQRTQLHSLTVTDDCDNQDR